MLRAAPEPPWRLPTFYRMFDARVSALIAGVAPLDETGRFLAWARYCQIHQEPDRQELARALARLLGLKAVGAGVGPLLPGSEPGPHRAR